MNKRHARGTRKPNRREFGAAIATGFFAESIGRTGISAASPGSRMNLCVFSKHLQWLDYEEMAATAVELGFDGVDLTVRPGGHVEPDRVKRDLPRAIKAIRAAGLEIPMITTAITDATSPASVAVLEAAAQQGIGHYRMGYFRYEPAQSISETLDLARKKLEKLEVLNRRLGICGDYQNHAGSRYVGASVWDLRELLGGLDPRWLGCQFDIRHATVEGGLSWSTDFKAVTARTHTLVLKDFRWQLVGEDWSVENCPIGSGMVRFKEFFELLKASGFSGPVSLHFEYALGGADHGARQLESDAETVLRAMRGDVAAVRQLLTPDSSPLRNPFD